MPGNTKFLWVDMEMSGLDVTTCRVLEVAALVTDSAMNPLEQMEAVVYQPGSVLDAMDAWCKENHGKSGLTDQVRKGVPETEVEKNLLGLLDRHFSSKDRIVLCGNSIGQDRKFIDAYFKQVAARLHYRMVDVTSFKEVFRETLHIEYKKQNKHRAIDDILESIAELKHYLSFIKAPDAN